MAIVDGPHIQWLQPFLATDPQTTLVLYSYSFLSISQMLAHHSDHGLYHCEIRHFSTSQLLLRCRQHPSSACITDLIYIQTVLETGIS